MAEAYETKEAKKVLRTIARLKYSLLADREIRFLLEEFDSVGAAGMRPKLEANLNEVLEMPGE